MRNLYLLIMAIFSLNASAQEDLTEVKDFGSNPGNLKMFLYKPVNTGRAQGKMPLVIALHGCTQNAKNLAELSGWNKLADTYGFCVVYPQQRTINNPSGCFNWFEEGDVAKDKGEVMSIKHMINYAVDSLSIDTQKIFVYGISAGAAMGVALLANYPGTFNMGAILAGGPFIPINNVVNALAGMEEPKDLPAAELVSYVKMQNPLYLGKYPRLLVMHGESDNVVNEKNSYLLIKQWAPLLKSDTLPTKTMPSFDGKADITRKVYCDSSGAEQIIFYEVANLGHALMVYPGDSLTQGGKTGIFAVDKGFFSTYWIAKDMGLIK